MRHVDIVQPYVPNYRVPLFNAMSAQLLQQDIRLTVWHGSPSGESVARNDADSAQWARPISEHQFGLGGHAVRWRALSEVGSPNLLVMEQALGNLEGVQTLLNPYFRRRVPIALWGHGRTYTHSSSRISTALKQAVTRRADWFFSYTESGAAAVSSRGFPANRVTVLNNTVDTSRITAEMDALTSELIYQFLAEARAKSSKVVAFIGGLDQSKRIPFLLESFELMLKSKPDLVLLVAGDGELREMIRESTMPIHYLGRVEARGKALIAKTSSLLLCPGRVGLVAIDSFAMQLPLVTTNWPWHAPEFEYLDHGKNAWISNDDPTQYAKSVIALLNDPPLLRSLRTGCATSLPRYSLGDMSDRFVSGIGRAMKSRP